MASRRFPPPWSVDELEACFVVKESSGQKLTYMAAKLLTKDEARRIALNIVKLPDLLGSA